MQDISISSVNALEILQPCTKPAICINGLSHESYTRFSSLFCCRYHTDGLVQDCGISTANTLDMLQFYTKQ